VTQYLRNLCFYLGDDYRYCDHAEHKNYSLRAS